MFHSLRASSGPRPSPSAAWTDYTPAGPWTDGQTVVRNLDGVGFIYSVSLNALTVVANSSFIAKNANSYAINNLPAPAAGGDAANKAYVDSHAGSGGGIPEAPNDGNLYGRESLAWSIVPPVPPPSTTVPGMDGTGAVGSATPYSRGDHIHPTDTTRAPLVSPTFTGTPAAPTPTAGTNTTQLATTQFVGTAISNAAVPAPSSTPPGMDGAGSAGTATSYSRGDHIHPSDTTKANLASPTFTGTPAAPNPVATDNSTTLATTQFVKAQGYIIANQTITLSGDITGSGSTTIATTLATVNSNVGTFQGLTVNAKGLVTAAVNMSYAPLASPTFTGNPLAPTPAVDDNDTSIATTAFVIGQASASGDGTPAMDGTAARGTAIHWARADHTHPTDTTRAPLASPALTGNPTTPNQAANDNSTKIANTAYVDTANALNLKVAGQQTTTNGFRFTSYNGGTVSSGTFTPDAYNGNYQYYTNNGAHTFAAPVNDCAIDILLTNGASAGTITFSGFTVSSNIGDALTTTSANKFIISARRINAISTYTCKALQ
jgi:hypothetical protein